MSRDLAKGYFVGNVGSDPTVRTTGKGDRVASFSLAVNRKRGGEEATSWFRVSAWRGLAEVVEKYVRKGSRVMVDGALSIDEYESGGEKRTSVEIDARDLVLYDAPDSAPATGSGFGSSTGSPFAQDDSLPFG